MGGGCDQVGAASDVTNPVLGARGYQNLAGAPAELKSYFKIEISRYYSQLPLQKLDTPRAVQTITDKLAIENYLLIFYNLLSMDWRE